MHLSGIGPCRQPRNDVELSEEAADDFVGVSLGTQAIELRHDFEESLLHISNRVLRVVLTLLVQTALTLDEFFAIEILHGVDDRFWQARIRKVACQALPQRGHNLDHTQSKQGVNNLSTTCHRASRAATSPPALPTTIPPRIK